MKIEDDTGGIDLEFRDDRIKGYIDFSVSKPFDQAQFLHLYAMLKDLREEVTLIR